MYLAGGVTTVRDVGNFDGDLRATQAAIRDGTFVFPRLIACARILEANPSSCPQSRLVRDAADAVGAVDEVVAAGGQCVAVRDSVPEDLRTAIDGAVRSRQLTVVTGSRNAGAHVAVLTPWHMSDLASHGLGAREPFQTFLPAPFFTMIWPGQVARVRDGGPHRGFREELIRAAAAAHEARVAGARLALGTGAPALYVAPGGSARIAIEELTFLGLTREEAWAAATRVAGEELGIAQLGSVEPGAPADLLVFREDPTQNADAFGSLEAVISQGRLYPSSVLLGQLMEYARFFRGWVTATRLALQTRWRMTTDPTELVECQLP
jgi:imidazolonepropionase-like amidohydrolase